MTLAVPAGFSVVVVVVVVVVALGVVEVVVGPERVVGFGPVGGGA